MTDSALLLAMTDRALFVILNLSFPIPRHDMGYISVRQRFVRRRLTSCTDLIKGFSLVLKISQSFLGEAKG